MVLATAAFSLFSSSTYSNQIPEDNNKPIKNSNSYINKKIFYDYNFNYYAEESYPKNDAMTIPTVKKIKLTFKKPEKKIFLV